MWPQFVIPALISWGMVDPQKTAGAGQAGPPTATQAAQSPHPEPHPTIWIHRVQPPNQPPRDVVALVSPADANEKGIIPEAVVGVLKQPAAEGSKIRPADFIRNPAGIDFVHDVIARHAPELKALQAEAKRQGNGWVYLIDGRVANPQGKVPPADILGAFEVKAGQIVAQSYRRNPNHVLLSDQGFFQLPPEIQQEVARELKARASRTQDPAQKKTAK